MYFTTISQAFPALLSEAGYDLQLMFLGVMRMKRIIFCADGTWDNKSTNTNVCKFFSALQTSADQIPFYDSGVGADGNPLEKIVGGAFGTGLFQKIKNGYTRIAHVYEKGDEIYLFGFSRGAYTARSLGGMIAICGLPTGSFSDDLVDTAFDAYRQKDKRAALLQKLSGSGMFQPDINMIGVWDTVGSLGIPAVFGGVSPLLYGFLDTALHPNVKHAYQALAIDERRSEFPPTLWTSQPVEGQTIEQVWFCGVHSDVGGGEPVKGNGPTTALSDITLSWMMKKAQSLGVVFDPEALKLYSYPLDSKYALDQLHDSWNPLWGFPRRRTVQPNSVLSNSVLIRCRSHDGYHPGNLTLENGLPSSAYQIMEVVAAAIEEALHVQKAEAQVTSNGAGGGN